MGFLKDPRWLRGCLLAVCALSLVLIFHNYVLNILPADYARIEPKDLQPVAPGTLAYSFPFTRSEPDGPYHTRSRISILEDGNALTGEHNDSGTVARLGQGTWAHEPGRIVFAAPDGSDPRTNGRDYHVTWPILYGHMTGWCAVLAFAAAVAGFYRLERVPSSIGTARRAAPAPMHWRWHLWGATSLFFLGLYCSTGTLAPYAVTTIPHYDPATGYLYNPDHPHFRALFDFVDGREKSTWDGALFLRRILYNVLAYPFMKAGGFELGGTVASITFNVAAFVVFIRGVRRFIGGRGAVFSAWVLALYPGAAYWAGLPYQHALIVPSSLLLMLVLLAIAENPGWRQVILGSLVMGVANLGYELFGFFLPATLIVLAWRRRWAALPVAAVLQVLPVIAWVLVLRDVFHQNLLNSNSGSFGAIAGAYLHIGDHARWRLILQSLPDVGMDIFFGANFLFLPLLFVVVLPLNAITSRVRPHLAEMALIIAAIALYLFTNAAPDYDAQWQLRGTWIERIYQPVFPALLLLCARWYQHLPPLGRTMRAGIFSLLGFVLAGNALIVFGPILNNPLGISGAAFYRFYDHANHANYELNLSHFGRRPLGFPAPAGSRE